MIEKFKNTISNIRKRPDYTILLITGVIMALFVGDKLFLHDYFHLQNIIFGFDLIFIFLFILLTILIVGFAVMKALVHVSAGLSLIIFLGQSYCSVPKQTENGDTALKFLIVIGLIYLIVDFIKIFYKGISEYDEIFTKIKREYFWKTILALFFLFIIFLFLWAIYQAINPIISSLCIYS